MEKLPEKERNFIDNCVSLQETNIENCLCGLARGNKVCKRGSNATGGNLFLVP